MPEKTATAGITWEQFTSAKGQRGSRRSKYADFVRDMKAKTVYNATAAFPKSKTDTLRSAIYGQAKRQKRKVQGIVREGQLLIGLAD